MKNKILIIGNEAIFINALLAKLSADKFAVITHNGISEINEIILFIKLNKPDYIILSLVLPRNNGFEMLAGIKSDDIIACTPIFIISNSPNSQTRIKCDNLGADYYLRLDDYNLDGLILKIENIIKNRKKAK